MTYRSAKRSDPIGGKFTTNAICRKFRNAGAYISLHMQMIGRRRTACLAFELTFFGAFSVTLSLMNLIKKSIVGCGAPSISSAIFVDKYFRMNIK